MSGLLIILEIVGGLIGLSFIMAIGGAFAIFLANQTLIFVSSFFIKPKACMKCGSRKVAIICIEPKEDGCSIYAANCGNCNQYGATASNPYGAVNLWNNGYCIN